MTRFLLLLIVSFIAIVVIMGQPNVSLAQWMEGGTPICTAAEDQGYPQLISDGTGGAIITWRDYLYVYRYGDIYVQMVDAWGIIQWDTNGIAICTAVGTQSSPQLIPDGTGGAIITWRDERSDTADIYAQRVDTWGRVRWTTNGIAICTAARDQGDPQLIPDGAGGAIITWSDYRDNTADIYAQRVSGLGTVLWERNGIPICTAARDQRDPQLIPDGAGGAIVTWYDHRSDTAHIYAQRVDSSGTILWDTNGVAISTKLGGYPQLISDGAGGAIITWSNERSDTADIYAQRVSGSGTPLWTANGVSICTAARSQSEPQLVSDGTGGAIITWQDHRNGYDDDIYVQRVNALGTVLWDTNGIPICTAVRSQSEPQLVSDGTGGAIIAWQDYRNGHGYHIYAQRVSGSGTVLWESNGVPICTAARSQSEPQLVSDGAGGAIITWQDYRHGCDIYAQRVLSNGVTGEFPIITSIRDVPHDQGGIVSLRWVRSGTDISPLEVVTHYSIWRSLPNGKLIPQGTRQISPAEVGPDFNGPAYRVIKEGGKTFYWEWIGNQQAHYLAHYSYTAPTLYDSSSATPGWHYFLVSAHTSDPFIFWDSKPDSGYSVDNLAPSAPQGLTVASGDTSINLIWRAIPDGDFRYYAIYRGRESGFTPDSSNLLGTTIDTAYSDLEVVNDSTYYYRISAFDFAGNEGEYSDEVSCKFTGIYANRNVELPVSFSLSQNYPNPFNPMTEIRYTLPKDCYVRLEVYNILGEKVVTLVDEKQAPGYKAVTWDAKDVGSGVYLYRLQAGGFMETRRMILLK